MLNLVDVFSGAGGLTEGFRDKNDYHFICHIEMDKEACSSLELRNIYYYLKKENNLSLYFDYIQGNISREKLVSMLPSNLTKDILNKEISEESMALIFEFINQRLGENPLDGIIGGPPCQSYSTIGRANNKAKKANDKRIYLYKYYVELLDKYHPKFFIFENVKGLLSFKDVEGKLLLPQIIREFDQCGYKVDYQIVDASEYGVGQKRERLFIVGHRKDLFPKQLFFDCLAQYKEAPPLLKELFMDLPKIQSGSDSRRYATSLYGDYVKKYIRNEEDILTYHIARKNNENDLKIYQKVVESKMKGLNLKYSDLPRELQSHSNVSSFLDRYKALDYDSISHTVVAHISKDGHYYIHPDLTQNRSITVREAARIQSFPDNFYFERSRTAAFKQIGNAVPPVLSQKLARAILDFIT